MLVMFLAHGAILTRYGDQEHHVCFPVLDRTRDSEYELNEVFRRAYSDIFFLYRKRGDATVPFASNPPA